MKIVKALATLGTIGVLFPAGLAEARSFRVQNIPNGGVFQCVSCHTDASASSFTNFGSNARSHLEDGPAVQQANVIWSELCPLDSDNDGRSNGEELGDPDCIWSPGLSPSSTSVSNPGVQNGSAMQCNNGKLDQYEQCDSAEIMQFTKCVDAQAGAGALGCQEDCSYDYSDCSNPPEGWDKIGPVEETDESCSVGTPLHRGGLALGCLSAAMMALGMRTARRSARHSARERVRD